MNSSDPPARSGPATTGQEPAPSSDTEHPPSPPRQRPGRPTPDKEGGAPVDELDLDGDGSRLE
jgi:hypothetical protein